MKFKIDAPILEADSYPEVLFVNRSSDDSLKEHLALLARYFRKEMGFDHLQFDESMYDNEDFTGFLLLQRAMDLVERVDHYPNRIIGAGIFENSRGKFELDWVWIHPFFRNRGALRDQWGNFKSKFGQFTVAEPLSAQMSEFLKKHPSQ